MSKETDALQQFLVDAGVAHVITAITGSYVSAKDPCHPHAPGSYHCRGGTGGPGLAIDVADHYGTHDTNGLLAIRNAIHPVDHLSAEVIYAGPGAPDNIKNGRPFVYDTKTLAGHHDHVHWAVEKGTLVQYPKNPGAAMAQVPNAVDACLVPGTDRNNPGIWVLAKDGGVFTFGPAQFHGSYPGLPQPQKVRNFIKIDPEPDGRGYVILDDSGAHYRFVT